MAKKIIQKSEQEKYCIGGQKWLFIAPVEKYFYVYRCAKESEAGLKAMGKVDKNFIIRKDLLCQHKSCVGTDGFYRLTGNNPDILDAHKKILLLVYVSHWCPQACIYCVDNPENKKLNLPPEDFKGFLLALKKQLPDCHFEIRWTGGEPLYCTTILDLINVTNEVIERPDMWFFTSLPDSKVLRKIMETKKMHPENNIQVVPSFHPTGKRFNLQDWITSLDLLMENKINISSINMIQHPINEFFLPLIKEICKIRNISLNYQENLNPICVQTNPFWDLLNTVENQVQEDKTFSKL